MPVNSFKQWLIPAEERLFGISGGNLKEETRVWPKFSLVGINVLDLKALALWEQVFSKDKYYQERRRRTLIVGLGTGAPEEFKKYKVFTHNWEENFLEHLVFDIFLMARVNDGYDLYSGSEKGQLFLEKRGAKKYQHVEFAGPIAEEGQDKRMLLLKKKVDQSFDQPIWEELGKTCIACGKCSIVCPTCFCFDLEDKNDVNNTGRVRKWGNCFYNDFSLVAGGHKSLDTAKQKIYFWYTHKFVRIPKEYGLPGCVSCNRCSNVCPVGIKINEVLKNL